MDSIPTCRSRFTRPVFVWAVTALGTEIVVEWLLRRGLPQATLRMVSLLPLLPAMFFMLALVRAIQRMDELQKRICLESVFSAFVLTLSLTFIFTGLDRAGIYRTPGNDIGTFMMLIWACAYAFSAWRYR
jgi:hypothetical protein